MAKISISLNEKITYTMRLDKSLRKAFEAAAKANDRPAAQLLRDFMRDYCKKHGQTDIFKG